jgi:Lsr2
LRQEEGAQVVQRVSVTYACDYDDKEIADGQQRTIAFGLDGREYEIDLCLRHSERLSEIIGKFAEHARKPATRGIRRRRRTAANRQRSADIRSWARSSGIPVSDRGRIPGHVLAGFETKRRQG